LDGLHHPNTFPSRLPGKTDTFVERNFIMTYGPIDFYVLEFQNENLKGEILPALVDLVQKEIIRVVDLVIIQKNKDGSHEAVELQELDPDTLAVYDPLHAEISGLIQVEDIDAIAEKMDNETTAAALMIENVWAIHFIDTLLNAKARLIEHTRIPHEDVEEAMSKISSAEA
jgi:hypothetical protein